MNATAMAEGAAAAEEVLIERETYDALRMRCQVRLAQNDQRYVHVEHIDTKRDFQRAATIIIIVNDR